MRETGRDLRCMSEGAQGVGGVRRRWGEGAWAADKGGAAGELILSKVLRSWRTAYDTLRIQARKYSGAACT